MVSLPTGKLTQGTPATNRVEGRGGQTLSTLPFQLLLPSRLLAKSGVRKVSVPRVSVSPVGRRGGLGFDSDSAPALLVD